MIKAEYRDPRTDVAVTAWISGEGELPGLLDAIVMIHGGCGHPALELTRPVGSSLVAATDGTRCALVWINTLEESFHSTGGHRDRRLSMTTTAAGARHGRTGPSPPPKPSAAPVTSYSTARRTRNSSFSSLTYQLPAPQEAVMRQEPHADPPFGAEPGLMSIKAETSQSRTFCVLALVSTGGRYGILRIAPGCAQPDIGQA